MHSCKIGAHAIKLLGPQAFISVAFSSRLSTIHIPKERAEVVLSPWEPSWGFSWGGT